MSTICWTWALCAPDQQMRGTVAGCGIMLQQVERVRGGEAVDEWQHGESEERVEQRQEQVDAVWAQHHEEAVRRGSGQSRVKATRQCVTTSDEP